MLIGKKRVRDEALTPNNTPEPQQKKKKEEHIPPWLLVLIIGWHRKEGIPIHYGFEYIIGKYVAVFSIIFMVNALISFPSLEEYLVKHMEGMMTKQDYDAKPRCIDYYIKYKMMSYPGCIDWVPFKNPAFTKQPGLQLLMLFETNEGFIFGGMITNDGTIMFYYDPKAAELKCSRRSSARLVNSPQGYLAKFQWELYIQLGLEDIIVYKNFQSEILMGYSNPDRHTFEKSDKLCEHFQKDERGIFHFNLKRAELYEVTTRNCTK